MDIVVGVLAVLAGSAVIVWGAEAFAEHLGAASVRLGVSMFALALLLAGAEPEELATTVTASLRHVPAVAFGDVIGANIAACLVALGIGAIVASRSGGGGLPFGPQVRRYAVLGIPLGATAVIVMWDGQVGRGEGALLVALYIVYVGAIWMRERRPPMIGEVAEVEAAADALAAGMLVDGARELRWVIAGVAAMIVGALLLVVGLERITGVESTQTDLGLTLVGFATAFELVVLAWSAARRGISEAVVAAVVGSFAYNATMSLGVAALARPLVVVDAGNLRVPLVLMLGSLVAVLLLALPRARLTRGGGIVAVAAYPVFVAYVAIR